MTVELDCLRLFPSLRSTRWTAAAGFFTDEVQLSVKRLSLLLPPSLPSSPVFFLASLHRAK